MLLNKQQTHKCLCVFMCYRQINTTFWDSPVLLFHYLFYWGRHLFLFYLTLPSRLFPSFIFLFFLFSLRLDTLRMWLHHLFSCCWWFITTLPSCHSCSLSSSWWILGSWLSIFFQSVSSQWGFPRPWKNKGLLKILLFKSEWASTVSAQSGYCIQGAWMECVRRKCVWRSAIRKCALQMLHFVHPWVSRFPLSTSQKWVRFAWVSRAL